MRNCLHSRHIYVIYGAPRQYHLLTCLHAAQGRNQPLCTAILSMHLKQGQKLSSRNKKNNGDDKWQHSPGLRATAQQTLSTARRLP